VGHEVTGVEVDERKLAALRAGQPPFYEPGLAELLTSGTRASRLSFTADFARAMDDSEIVFICVGTPSGPDGQPDLSAMKTVANSIAANLRKPHLIVNKSTVPIGTGRWLMAVIEEAFGSLAAANLLTVASNPEFLREGNSVQDFLQPDRIVIGSDDPAALETLSDLYRPILEQDFPGADSSQGPVPLVRTSLTTAEMTKYASNAFLATKISFANEMARICDMVGADVTEVTEAMGLDARIGSKFLDAGLGWGGSCFPKDILALITTAAEYGYRPRILDAALAVNANQRRVVLDALLYHLKTLRGARVGLLGLAFKPGTDDLRDSAALDVARMLTEREAIVVAHDPMVNNIPGVRTVDNPLDVANGADAVVLATEWPEYLGLDLHEVAARMRGTLFFDGRNVFNPMAVQSCGLKYVGIGRASGSAAASRKPLPVEGGPRRR
jgi:UDPglucose 6-dehydrogenase